MKTSETISKLAIALLQAQKGIKFATKDATNPHYKNRYADLPSVIDAIKEHLNNAGIVYIQTPSPSDPGYLALTTRLIHESGEWLEDMATVPLPKSDPQGYGSAITYVRRYALSAITGLYQDDDDGNGATTGQKQFTTSSTTVETPEPDAEILAQFNAAKTVAALTKVMNGLSQEGKRLYSNHFNARMGELKKAV